MMVKERLRPISLEPEEGISSVEYVGDNGLPTFRVDYVKSNPNHPGTKMVRIYRKREEAEEQVAAFRFWTDNNGKIMAVDDSYIPDICHMLGDNFYIFHYLRGENKNVAELSWASRLQYDPAEKRYVQTAGGYSGSIQFEELRRKSGFPQEIDLIKTVSMYVFGIYENEHGQAVPLTAQRIAQMPVVTARR